MTRDSPTKNVCRVSWQVIIIIIILATFTCNMYTCTHEHILVVDFVLSLISISKNYDDYKKSSAAEN